MAPARHPLEIIGEMIKENGESGGNASSDRRSHTQKEQQSERDAQKALWGRLLGQSALGFTVLRDETVRKGNGSQIVGQSISRFNVSLLFYSRPTFLRWQSS